MTLESVAFVAFAAIAIPLIVVQVAPLSIERWSLNEVSPVLASVHVSAMALPLSAAAKDVGADGSVVELMDAE